MSYSAMEAKDVKEKEYNELDLEIEENEEVEESKQ